MHKVLENTNIRSGKLNGSTSFENDNMYYINFKIYE